MDTQSIISGEFDAGKKEEMLLRGVRNLDTTEKSGDARIAEIVHQIFKNYPGNIAIKLWTGRMMMFGTGVPEVTLVFHDAHLFRELILFRDPLRLAEAFFQGEIDVEGDLYQALKLKEYLRSLTFSFSMKMSFLFAVLFTSDASNMKRRHASVWKKVASLLPFKHANSRKVNREAIAFHYDVSNDFYRLWLDEKMVYSCAYFKKIGNTLSDAQDSKLEHICRKLQLKQGERMLDIGSGWGALICWAAKNYGVQAHGITLSHEQYTYTQQTIREQGLQDLVTVELKDYRDLEGESVYDKISSVGMFEHVGIKNLPLYFATAQKLLKPGGLFLNHGITQDQEGWKNTVGTRFINRYVFPDGELDTVANVQRNMERAGFEILDVEALRSHYALTLRHWVKRLAARKTEALRYVSEPVYRVWYLYMVACALQFEQGDIGVYQLLLINRDGGRTPVSLTRQDLYT